MAAEIEKHEQGSSQEPLEFAQTNRSVDSSMEEARVTPKTWIVVFVSQKPTFHYTDFLTCT